MDQERIAKMNDEFFKDLHKFSEKHPDLKLLLASHEKIKTQASFSLDFLNGYLSCISDLRFIKKTNGYKHKKEKVDCETCYGKGQVVISCCSNEVINDDFAMCPTCHEHLGEEDCPDCDGAGKVDPEKNDFLDKIPGLSTMAETQRDALKYKDL